MTYNICQNCIVDLYNCTSNIRVSFHFNIQFLFIIEHCKIYDSWIFFLIFPELNIVDPSIQLRTFPHLTL